MQRLVGLQHSRKERPKSSLKFRGLTFGLLLILSGCSDQKRSASKEIEAAQALLDQGNTDKALPAILDALRVDKQNKRAHLLAGQIREARGEIDEAAREYFLADQLDRHDPAPRLKVVELLVDANALDAASVQVNAAFGDYPGDLDGMAWRALIDGRQGKATKAKRDASAVLAAAPANAVAHAALAEALLRDNQPDRALTEVEQGLVKNRNNAALLRLQALCFVRLNTPQKAIASYQALVATMPRSAPDRAALAGLQAEVGLVDAGEHTLRDGVAAAASNRQMRLQLATYLFQHGGAGSAERELRTAIANEPGGSVFDLARADLLVSDGRAETAAETLRSAANRLEGKPAKAAAVVGLARVLLSQNQPEAAKIALDDLLEKDATNDDARLLRATCLLQLRQAEAALADVLPVTSRRPSDSQPFLLLADVFRQQGKTDDARDALKRVVDLQPADLEAATRLASFCRSVGQADCAQTVLDAFVGRNPASLEGRAAAIRNAIAAKNWPAAQSRIAELRRQPKADALGSSLEGELDEAQGQFASAATAYARILQGGGSETPPLATADAYVRVSLAAGQGDAAVKLLVPLTTANNGALRLSTSLALARLYGRLGQLSEALALVDRVIAGQPKALEGYLRKAALLQESHDGAGARKVLSDGRAADAPPEPLLLARAALESDAGEIDTAIATYRELLAKEPRSVVAANNLVSLLADRKPLDVEGLRSARDMLVRLPNGGNAAVLDTLAWADFRLGDSKTAKSLLLQAGADTIAVPQLRYHLGAVLLALGETDPGRALLKTVLGQNFPDRPQAEALLAE